MEYMNALMETTSEARGNTIWKQCDDDWKNLLTLDEDIALALFGYTASGNSDAVNIDRNRAEEKVEQAVQYVKASFDAKNPNGDSPNIGRIPLLCKLLALAVKEAPSPIQIHSFMQKGYESAVGFFSQDNKLIYLIFCDNDAIKKVLNEILKQNENGIDDKKWLLGELSALIANRGSGKFWNGDVKSWSTQQKEASLSVVKNKFKEFVGTSLQEDAMDVDNNENCSLNSMSFEKSSSNEFPNDNIRIDERFVELAFEYQKGSKEYENNLLSSVLYPLRNYINRHGDDKQANLW